MPKEKLDLPESLDIVEFISKEAHDLRSPFNRILGFTKMVLKGMDGPLTDPMREDLGIVFSNSTQALTLINGLIDMSRLARGEKAFSPKTVVAQNLVDQAIANWKKVPSEKEVIFETAFPAEEISLPADENLLRQTIEHLMAYLVEYSESPVTVRIQVEAGERVSFRLSCQGKKSISAAAANLTMWAYVARLIIQLHGGQLADGEGDETGASLQFWLPAGA